MTERITIRVNGLTAKARLAIGDSDEPNDGAIADQLLGEVTEDEIRAALKLVVKREASAMRREAVQRAEAEARVQVETEEREGRVAEARERLDALVEQHRDQVAERFFASWKQTPSGRKFFGECTAEDLRWSAKQHEQRSLQSLDAAGRDSRLADAIEGACVVTVRDLGYDAASRALVGGS